MAGGFIALVSAGRHAGRQPAAAFPLVCQENAGFDRAAFHEQFNREVVAFFQKTLDRR